MKMILRNLQFSKEDFKLLTGFEPTFVTLAPLSIFVTLLGLWGQGGNPEVVLALPPAVAAAILAGVAVTGAVTSGIASAKAGKAAKEAAKKTSAERALATEIDQIQTGVDAAAVDTTIASGAVPIGAAIGTQQTGIAQDVLAAEGGSGVPGSALTGRGAALQRQLASEGTEAIADLSLGARKQQEEMAAIRQEQRHGLMGLEGQLASARRGQVAGLKAQQSAGLSQMGSSLLGGAATGSSGELTSSTLS